MELITLIGLVLSIAFVVAFFIMASNIGTLTDLNRKQVLQNDRIIALLERLAMPPTPKSDSSMSVEEKAKAYDESLKSQGKG